uniref:Reverse transcriptase domain-containing protein n=1 Tax=Nicotiana tabacum TaxID=4097 RepID=A0A1S4CCD5_TOBAC|nr:PREDICTED: uncharacterized protein LOC107817478 [Nicotiana tabacum]
MPKWTDPLNHLAYADDTIIFASANPYSLRKVIEVLTLYEQTSGQLINKAKSSNYMHANVAGSLFSSVGAITGFHKGGFPFTYLGCPIFYTRRRKDYYNDVIKKVKAKLHSWKGKLLSYGGKATLITSVLQNMSTHILSVLDPPDNVLKHLHKTFARFFWSKKEEGKSSHWTKWLNLCLLKDEGGLGFRSLFDVSKALFAKLWWKFRTTKFLRLNFMWNKYCKKELPTVVQFREGSHMWRKMLKAREEVEHEILWEMNRELHEVAELREEDNLNDQIFEQSFPGDIVDHIRQEVHFDDSDEYGDTPKWMPTTSSIFKVSSAWQILRYRAPINAEYKLMWTKGTSGDKSMLEYSMLPQAKAIDAGSTSCDHTGALEEEKYNEEWRSSVLQ